MSVEQRNDSSEMGFFDHVEALRPHLVRGVAAIVLIGIAAFFAKGFIIDTVLFGPQMPEFPTNRMLAAAGGVMSRMCEWINSVLGTSLSVDPAMFSFGRTQFETINTSMAGQFNLHMKVSLFTGVVLATPYVLWEFWRFVKPALTEREIAGTRMFVTYVSLCFFTGLLFGYFIIVPLSINFFINYEASTMITNMIDVGEYLSTVLTVSFACAVMFELPLLIYFLTRMGLVSAAFLRKYRRHAFVVLLVVAAIITPPDIFSLVLVVVPLYGLYELSINLAGRIERREAESNG